MVKIGKLDYGSIGPGKNELVMAWNDLTLVQKNLLGKPVKNILDSLNGQINFHSLTALMGPSGAGKTSLLKCVNMRSNAGLTADTQMFVSKYTELRTAFIMQSADEHIINGLTVRESLLFASKLKNKKSVGLKGRDNIAAETGDSASLEPGLGRKHQVIDETVPLDIDGNFDHDMNVRRILLDLLLADCADNAVQTCSGGEQKRLTIGLELVQQNKPNLMCIDEPTSGLDSNASEMVIQCLKELSERHRMAIVTSIHQPNSLLLSMFTQLYVLSKGGHCVFAGRPNLLKDHLNSCGITCPEDVQPIELLLKIATNFPNDKFQSSVRNQSLNIESTDGSIDPKYAINRLIETSKCSSIMIRDECQRNGKLISKALSGHQLYFNFYDLYYLTLRGLICFLRYDWITTLGFGIFLTSLGVILCYLYGWDIGETDGCLDLMVANSSQPTNSSLDGGLELPREQSDVTENLKLLFFACGAAGFVAMASTVLAFPAEVRVFLNEHRNRWYSTSSYYWSKSLIEIPVTVTLSVLYSTIIFYASGQESDEFFRYGYFVMVNAGGLLVGNGIGHVFGIVFAHNYQLAIITSVAFYLTVFLLGGFPIRLYTQDGFIRAISYISCVKFNFYSNVITLYAFDRCDSTQISLALKQFDLKHDEMWDNCAWILGQLVFFRIFGLLALMYKVL